MLTIICGFLNKIKDQRMVNYFLIIIYYYKRKSTRDECFVFFVLNLLTRIHVAHDFSNLFFTGCTTHASKHCANHFFVNRWVFSELFLEDVTSDKETRCTTRNKGKNDVKD